jgi:isopenicillin N synthase-like dioxygenase
MAYNARKYPPFPEGVPVAPLVTISLKSLLEGPSNPEHERLFEASKNLGFFYLDMRDAPVGEDLLSEADTLFDLSKEFFDMPLEEKNKYDFVKQRIYFGYKGTGKEILSKDGTLNRDQQYNVSSRFQVH